MIENNSLITARTLADELNLSIETIWRYTREERIPYIVLGNKRYRYRLPDVMEALSTQYVVEEQPRNCKKGVMHQRVSRRLYRVLYDYFWKNDPEGEVFFAPLDVTFPNITVEQPDLLYVSGAKNEIIQSTGIDGAPTLVVEIISPSSVRKDRLQKLQIYQKAGVEHYWIVSPQEKILECFHLIEGFYRLIVAGTDEDTVEHPVFPGLAVSLKTLWEGRI